jgi:hypothetical protein
MPTEGGSRIFRLPQYVVVRDPMGNWHEIVAKESVHRTTLEEATKEAVTVKDPSGDPEEDDEDIDVFTRITRKDGKAEWYQEINDVEVPGSRGKSEIEDSPYIPLRWAALENENYGRGHVEEYLGDLRSLEELSKSLVAFAVAAAKVIFLDRPNSVTDIEAIENAESGEFVEGNPEAPKTSVCCRSRSSTTSKSRRHRSTTSRYASVMRFCSSQAPSVTRNVSPRLRFKQSRRNSKTYWVAFTLSSLKRCSCRWFAA